MNKILYPFLVTGLLLSMSFSSSSQTISTVAGNGYGSRCNGGYSGDGGLATNAELDDPSGVTMDSSGNIYFADYLNNRIRKVTKGDTIITIAGNGYGRGGSGAYSGDGGLATDAELYEPLCVAVDASGNIYIADTYNNRIRVVNKAGIIETFAGTGISGYSGDGGQATEAELFQPTGVATDASGNVYIADYNNQRIRKVNTSGIISTFAGNGFGAPNSGGYSGDSGLATAAELYFPEGVSVDAMGNVYIADYYNNRIRKVNTSGIISTVAGNGIPGYSGDGGQATAAELNQPTGVSTDASGNLYIADYLNSRIRKVNTSGVISTIAGTDSAGFSGDGELCTDAELNYPTSVVCSSSGNIYIGDCGNNRIRKINFIFTGVDKILSNFNKVKIYPIPNDGNFTISGTTEGQVIELYDNIGQLLSTTLSNNSIAQFDISNEPNGLYFIKILNKDGSIFTQEKILKVK